MEDSRERKCLLALVSIATGYAASRMPEHMLDVGGKCRIGVDLLPELARSNAELDREPEDVDELLALMPDEMSAENPAGRLVDDDLRPCRRLGVSLGGEPAEHVVDIY